MYKKIKIFMIICIYTGIDIRNRYRYTTVYRHPDRYPPKIDQEHINIVHYHKISYIMNNKYPRKNLYY